MGSILRRRRGWPPLRPAVAVAAALIASLALAAPRAAAQPVLSCGVPVMRSLPAGDRHVYRFTAEPGAAVLIQASDVSGTLGLVRLRVTGQGGLRSETCSGVNQFIGRAGEMTLEVAPCSPASGGGDYTVTLQVVSGGRGNCGQPLGCGATPDSTGFRVLGEVDAFVMPMVQGEPATLRANYLDAQGAPALRVFDPLGNPVGGIQCSSTVTVTPTMTGMYTALASACGASVLRAYRISFQDFTCPVGPVVTHFGVANAETEPLRPIGYDPATRPIYNVPFGQGITLVVEARTGASMRPVAPFPVPYQAGGMEQPADMQAIVSNPLGDGNPTVCDTARPLLGGVPATVPFAFRDTAAAQAIIADLGCRFINGAGIPAGRTDPDEACTRTGVGFGFSFVDRASNIQFCAPIASSWSFPPGDTRVAVRIKDVRGNFGEPREIVVRVGEAFSPTPSFTPTATRTESPEATPTRPPTLRATATATRSRTPSRTRTPTPTPTGPTPTPDGPCAADCDGDRQVTVAELTVALSVALGRQAADACPVVDADGDGTVMIGEVLRGVLRALNGCPGA